jgi:sugar-specific transcriptional regulator TrmB
MKPITTELMELGFTEYEAKVYLSLLRQNPATAYETGKSSGIPTSKIYEVMKKLVEKGIIAVIDEHKTKRYTPVEYDEVLNSFQRRTESIIGSLRNRLEAVRGEKDFSSLWTINEYDYLIEKIRRMIREASETLLLSVWKEDLELIENELRDAVRRNVRIAMIHFGITKTRIGQVFHHPIEDTIYLEKGGRGIVVVADSQEVLMGTVSRYGKVEGAWSRNRGFATLAEDYIKHDIYIMKIVRRFDTVLKERFGKRYEKLRNIFSDEEAQ